MAYEHKANTGSLFKSDKKGKETDRDYQGDALINGVEVWMSAWINETKDGKKYMKVSFSPKDGKDESIPF